MRSRATATVEAIATFTASSAPAAWSAGAQVDRGALHRGVIDAARVRRQQIAAAEQAGDAIRRVARDHHDAADPAASMRSSAARSGSSANAVTGGRVTIDPTVASSAARTSCRRVTTPIRRPSSTTG